MASEILIILGLIFLNGLFAMTEIAMVSVRKTKLEHAAANGDYKSEVALKIISKPGKFLSMVQIGMTLINIFTGVYSGAALAGKLNIYFSNIPLLHKYSHSLAISTVVILATFFTLLLGELIPKRIGLIRAESVARNVSVPMRIFSIIIYPLIWILTEPGEQIIRLFKIRPSEDSKITEDEIKAIIKESTEDGEIQKIEQDILGRVFQLGDRKVGSLMTHRSDLVWLNVNDSEEQIKNCIISGMFNVYPVCEDNLDKVKGIIYIKDLFTSNLNKQPLNLLKNLKEPLFIPESNTAYEVLEKFRSTGSHFGLVIDEYGSIIGLVTLNDILMALVGEMQVNEEDEYKIIMREDGSWLIDAQLPFYDFIQKFDIRYFDKKMIKFNTLGGFVLAQMRKIPSVGDQFIWREFEFAIIKMDGNRIDKILVKRNE